MPLTRLKAFRAGGKDILTTFDSWEAVEKAYYKGRVKNHGHKRPGTPAAASSTNSSGLCNHLWESSKVDSELYSQLTPDSRKIRLLTLQAGEKTDRVDCELDVWPLDQAPTYYALSYVWGDERDTRPIRVNDLELQVTSNLESALRHIRKPCHAIRLWVDSVSINQADLAERSHQVSQMRDVYVFAARVLVWLGPTTRNSRRAMKLLHYLGLEFVCEQFSCDPSMQISLHERRIDSESRPIAAGHGYPSLPPPYDNASWDGVTELFHKPWFSRMWTMQEIVVASDVSVLCGDQEIQWQRLISATTLIGIHNRQQGTNAASRSRMIDLCGYNMVLEIEMYRKRFEDKDDEDAFDLLYHCWDRKSKDPRDKIYALLGLVDEWKVTVDYSLPAAKVYTSFIASIIASSQNLEILRAKQSSEPDNTLPSWVPNWAAPALQNPPNHGAYSAAGRSVTRAAFSHPGFLLLQGLVIDKVKNTGPVVKKDVPMFTDFWYVWECIAYGKLDIKDWRGSVMDVLGYDILDRRREEPYVAGGTMHEAFSRTQMADLISGSTRVPSKTCVSDIFKIMSGRMDIPRAFEPGQPNEERLEHYTGRYRTAMIQAIRERKIFTTEGGYMGLCLPSVEAGDLVCVMLGGSAPFVLRQEGARYVLVGEAYGKEFSMSIIVNTNTPSSRNHGW